MHLLGRITHFLDRTGMPETKFGRLAVHDPRFVSDLRAGREPRPSTIARIERFIANGANGEARR